MTIALLLLSLLVAVVPAPVLSAQGQPAAGGDCVTIENFATDAPGQFPPRWKARKSAGRKIYSVQEEPGLKFLRAASRGQGIQAGLQHEWDLNAYPMLAWSWRVRQFPRGADERDSSKNDSAASVYAVFPLSSFAVKAVKYVWSEVVPVGTHLTSNHGLTQVRVVRTGTAGANQWVEERVNVLEDYRRYFGGGEVPKPEGIAVLTDSDDTHSSAQADYTKFRTCRESNG